jgi:hypothetical protein
MRMDKKPMEVRFRIQFTHSNLKPKARRMCFMYFQLTISKDFVKTSFIIMLELCEYLSECIYSRETITLSRIFLPSTYPYCSFEILKGRRVLRRREITLAMIF